MDKRDSQKISVNNKTVDFEIKNNVTKVGTINLVSSNDKNRNAIENPDIKKPIKALHLNHSEKDMFFSALSLGHTNCNFTRTTKLISVETLYGIFIFINN